MRAVGRGPVLQIDPNTGLPRTVFEIPQANYDKFEAQIAKLSRKSQKLIGLEIDPVPYGRTFKDFPGKPEVLCIEVLLTAEIPRINGWTFIARLDHANETGTIIRSVPNVGEVPAEYRQSAPNCDHCGIKRRRRDTFLLRCDEGDAKGTYKQVGSSCLVDFFGHDPYRIARLAELLGYAAECARGAEWYDPSLNDHRYVDVEGYMAHAARAIRKYGWTSAKDARETGRRATKDEAFDSYCNWTRSSEAEITEADRNLAADALSWAQGFADNEDLSDWQHNCLVVANAEVMEFRSIGLAASIVGVYVTRQTRETAGESLKVRIARSQPIGKEGERLHDVGATCIGHKAFENTFGGTTHLYRFITDADCLAVWFATREQDLDHGQKVSISGSVKKHEIRDGVVQTVLTRCKVNPATA